jgi:hypothetical protein
MLHAASKLGLIPRASKLAELIYVSVRNLYRVDCRVKQVETASRA